VENASSPAPALTRTELVARTRALFEESISAKRAVLEGDHLDTLATMAERAAAALGGGGRLLLCGNGGSAADAQHLAAELLVRLRPMHNRQGVAAIALAMDSSTMTACANDYGYDALYARMVETLGRPGDVVLGITTSGKSPNIIQALETARRLGMTTMGFLGAAGGPALPFCDLAFRAPSTVTGRVQEMHITAGHALMEMIEDLLLESGRLTLT
jgi:D-sedoheptulose 7-phosphate isomerase